METNNAGVRKSHGGNEQEGPDCGHLGFSNDPETWHRLNRFVAANEKPTCGNCRQEQALKEKMQRAKQQNLPHIQGRKAKERIYRSPVRISASF